jgi:hypothetical protein
MQKIFLAFRRGEVFFTFSLDLPFNRTSGQSVGLRRPGAHPWLSYLQRSYIVSCHCGLALFESTLRCKPSVTNSGLA